MTCLVCVRMCACVRACVCARVHACVREGAVHRLQAAERPSPFITRTQQKPPTHTTPHTQTLISLSLSLSLSHTHTHLLKDSGNRRHVKRCKALCALEALDLPTPDCAVRQGTQTSGHADMQPTHTHECRARARERERESGLLEEAVNVRGKLKHLDSALQEDAEGVLGLYRHSTARHHYQGDALLEQLQRQVPGPSVHTRTRVHRSQPHSVCQARTRQHPRPRALRWASPPPRRPLCASLAQRFFLPVMDAWPRSPVGAAG